VIVGILLIILAAADAGLWAWLLVGAVGLVVAGVLALWFAKRHRHPVAWDAPRVSRPSSDRSHYRVLVIADDACTPEALRGTIAGHAAGRDTEAFVIAPALGSRLAGWTGDQSGYEKATAHLEATLLAFEQIGVTAHGRIGSPDPIEAADDGLREFAADEIILAVHPDNAAKWLERDAIDAARERYAIPVTAIVVELS
jgi:hypothetical protein